MKNQQSGTQARVLGAALRAWASTGPPAPHAARIVIRQAPEWGYVTTIGLTKPQTRRVLGMLRADLALTHHPEQALDAILDEHRVAGRRRLHSADLTEIAARLQQSRAWLAQRLTHLADQGHIAETWRPGTYRI